MRNVLKIQKIMTVPFGGVLERSYIEREAGSCRNTSILLLAFSRSFV
jgi:hypothetical protein